MKSTDQLISESKEVMVQEFSKQVELLESTYSKMNQKELKKQILKLNKDVIASKENLGTYHLILAALIYKKRFKREIPLKGVEVDASGSISYSSSDNIYSNI
ncbi:hypothetical protein [Vagococcus fluvialis]|uniref:hypothetical protein n=1 Tax=Vagococcus fluvialis TaxID=2738 RepID=UPI002B31E61B|nr:hypothetical protein QDW48_11905 [Vagococcus fluvialis]